jgi:hypothetical protein
MDTDNGNEVMSVIRSALEQYYGRTDFLFWDNYDSSYLYMPFKTSDGKEIIRVTVRSSKV